jgi:hypothetical protein
MNINSFKEWLINEGAMGLPYKVYKNIVDFYVYAKTEYALSPRKEIAEKTISLDFEGTSFDFLQVYNPKLIVNIKNAELIEGSAGIYFYGSFAINREGAIGRIGLAAKSGGVITSTIEHEVLHFVQDLLKLHSKESVASNPLRRDKRWVRRNGLVSRPNFLPSKKEREKGSKFKIGGLSDKKTLSRLLKKYDVHGWVHGTKKERRTTHQYRPIEQMTNLASLIAEKKMYYLEDILNELQINPLETTWIELKANPEFMKRIGDKKRKSLKTNSQDLKSLDPGSYRLYQREIYKKFVDSTDWEDTFELLKVRKNLKAKIEDINKDKYKKSIESNKDIGDLKGYKVEDFGKGVRVKVEYSDRYNFSNIDSFFSPEEADQYSIDAGEAAEEMFNAIGIKENGEGDFAFSVTAQNLKKLFDKIRKNKSTEHLQVKKCDWDYFAGKLASEAAYKLSDYMYKTSGKEITKEELLSIFYPDPPEICREI